MPKRMRIFYDTEFIEDGKTIDLISIGMVSEDGQEYYAVSSEFNVPNLLNNEWLMENVTPTLPLNAVIGPYGSFTGDLNRNHPDVKSREQIKQDILDFTGRGWPEFWANYSGFDYVCFAQLFGKMSDWPNHFPMFTRDIQQLKRHLGVKDLPRQEEGKHNALADARHNLVMFNYLKEVFEQKGLQYL